MAKGRPADFDLLSADERARLRELAGGDELQHKRLLMKALRDAKKRRTVLSLAAVGDPAAPAGQMHFAGEEFDLEVYDKNHKNELRRRCQIDLAFLCREIFQRDVTDRTHGPVFAFLGNPDPDRPLEGQLDPIRRRPWLDPRGTFKTSLVTDYAVQWTICFPEIRILFLGGEKTLAFASLDTYTETFVIRGEPTRFQRLFPEFCIHPGEKYERKYVAPCRRNPKRHKEPTAWANSLDSALSGWHPDMMVTDDAQNDENSGNFERIGKVKKVYYMARKLLEPVWGREVFTGTRHDPNDLGGELVGEISPHMRSLVRSALWAKPELPESRKKELEARMRDPNVASTEFDANDWELLFPERLSFAFLMGERGPGLEKFQTFGSQYLNDPVVAAGQATFTLEALREASVPANIIPAAGRIVSVVGPGVRDEAGQRFHGGGDGADRRERALLYPGADPWAVRDARAGVSDRGRDPAVESGGDGDRGFAGGALAAFGPGPHGDGFAGAAEDRLGAGGLFAEGEGRAGKVERGFAVPAAAVFFELDFGCMDDLYKEFCGYGKEAHDDIPDTISQIIVRHVRRLVEGDGAAGIGIRSGGGGAAIRAARDDLPGAGGV